MPRFSSVPEMVQKLAPLTPVHCIRHHNIKAATQWFIDHFPGKILYAVKTNPESRVLKTLYEAGIRNFDVASLHEINLVHELFPDANLHFMHTIKNREAIRRAYEEYNVRHFALDSEAELNKIIEATGNAKDLGLHIRIAVPNTYSQIDLSGKFGIFPTEAVELIKKARKLSQKLGICFHVGSQCMHPTAFTSAFQQAKDIILRAEVKIDVLDIGGGFPSIYPGMTPPPLSSYMEKIKEAISLTDLDSDCKIWCEPGRVLVAEAGSLVTQVELRKDNFLYINDGTYGSLFDAGHSGFIFPTQAIHPNKEFSTELIPFSLYGPTCDSTDYMPGPFYLPANIDEGDWIEFGQMGAYGSTLRTKFNGFYSNTIADVEDEPLMSLFEGFKKNGNN